MIKKRGNESESEEREGERERKRNNGRKKERLKGTHCQFVNIVTTRSIDMPMIIPPL